MVSGAVDFTRFYDSFASFWLLANLVANGVLVRVSKGVYAKTRVNIFTGKLAPAAPFKNIAAEAFRKPGIDVQPGRHAVSTTPEPICRRSELPRGKAPARRKSCRACLVALPT